MYDSFCKKGTLPVRPTADGFVKLITGSFFLPVFLAYVTEQGYSMEQIEEWEKDVFMKGDAEDFFQQIEDAIKQVNI